MSIEQVGSGINGEVVRLAYRLFLGREPENAAVVEAKVKKHKSLDSLRAEFLNSGEFYRRNAPAILPNVLEKSSSAARSRIDIDISETQLKTLIERLHETWTDLGETQAHYSVLSNPKYKPEVLKESLDEFKRTGFSEANRIKRTLTDLGWEPQALNTCLELGCGVGRVSRWLAEVFPKVYAVDISKTHLGLCQEYLSGEGVENVEVKHVVPSLSNPYPEHDFLYSNIVLQHNPPPIKRLILSQILDRLKSGGVANFQLVTHIDGYTFNAEEYIKNLSQSQGLELHVLPQDVVFEVIANTNCRPLKVYRDYSVSGAHRISTRFIVTKL